MPRRSNNKPPNVKQRGGQPEEYSWVQRERPAKFGDHQQIKIDVPGLFFVALLVVFVLGHSRMTHDGALRFVTMVMHFREGYRLVEKYERRRGGAYDVVVKVRPDLIYMAPFPSIAAVASRAVAHGVMTRTGRFQPVWK